MRLFGHRHERDVLARERRGRQYIYRPTAPRARADRSAERVADDRLVDRYGTAALRHFAVRLADLDPKTRQRLAALADEER